MKQILCLNKISPIGTEKLNPADYALSSDAKNPDAILAI